MKKFLAIALFLVLVASVFVVASGAAETEYWDVNRNCLVKVKGIEDEEGNITVPTFKAVEENNSGYDGLIVGLPTYATVGDKFFEPKDDYDFIYADAKGNELYYGDDHLGTADKIVVYDENEEIAATYGIVTYGDADGDGVFDVIDSAIAARCLNGFLDAADEPAVYEAVKPRIGVNNELIDILDYQKIVNDSVAGDVEENLKGRKIPIDETLYFESVIYENTGATRVAEFTAEDDNFKDLVTNISYNGSDEVVPQESGIYSVTVNVADSEKYLVTPGERNLGFIVIAPKSGSGYNITTDNTNKQITVNITNFYAADATFEGYISGWYNSAYNLKIGGTSITDGDSAISALPNRTVKKYSVESIRDNNGTTDDTTDDFTRLHQRLTDLPNVLGEYLPDDETLWEESEAENSRSVALSNGTSFDYTLVFKQDADTVEANKFTYFKTQSEGGRGQRSDSNTSAFVYAKVLKNHPAIRVAVKTPSAKCRDALGATGLKTLLVGYADAMAVEASTTTNFSSSTRKSLYNTSDDNRRVSNYNTTIEIALYCLGTINTVLKEMDMPTVGYSTKLSAYTGSSGYCNYICVSSANGLRYNVVYYLEFMDYAAAEDTHYTLTIGSNVTMVTPVKSTKYDAYSRMAGNEPIKATAPAGYKLKLTDANGNEISMQDEGYFLMPYSNATISAVAE